MDNHACCWWAVNNYVSANPWLGMALIILVMLGLVGGLAHAFGVGNGR